MRSFYPFFFLSMILLLNSCSSITGVGTDNSPRAAALADFKSVVKPVRVWSVNSAQKINQNNGAFVPAYSAESIVTAGSKGVVTSINRQTGKINWHIDLNQPLVSAVGVGNGIVVVGSENADVFALNSVNGKAIWHVKLDSQLTAAPVVTNNAIIVKSLSGKLTSLSQSNGSVLWVVNHGGPLMVLSGGSTPKVVDNKIINGYADGTLAAYSLGQGKVLWENQLSQPTGATDVEQMIDITASPEVSGNRVYTVNFQGNITAQDINTGQIIWQQPLSSNKGLVSSESMIYAVDSQGIVWGLNKKNGQVVFKQEGLQFRGLTSPVILNHWIVVGDKEGYIHWLDPLNGKTVGRIRTDSYPIVAIYADKTSNNLLVFNNHSDVYSYR
jgi:outer membrane protein assembly factor BamB